MAQMLTDSASFPGPDVKCQLIAIKCEGKESSSMMFPISYMTGIFPIKAKHCTICSFQEGQTSPDLPSVWPKVGAKGTVSIATIQELLCPLSKCEIFPAVPEVSAKGGGLIIASTCASPCLLPSLDSRV